MNYWETVQERGYITWITRSSPLTFYTSLDGIIGLEHDILSQFCSENNLELRIITAKSNSSLFAKFAENKIDIAGANLTLTAQRKEQFYATTAYDKTNTLLISSLRKEKIKSLNDLANFSGVTLSNSAYTDITDELQQKYQAKITEIPGISLYELLQLVIAGAVDYTIADSNIYEVYKLFIPRLRVGFKLSKDNDLVFLLSKKHDTSLQHKLNDFIKTYIASNKVADYKKFIASTLPNSKPADTVQFIKYYDTRWPNVNSLIYSTAEKFNVPPMLLGAIAYQESHWNAKAVSPTLVKGLMMLTKDVAKEQGVDDRNNPLQSLEGGVEYFLKMKNKMPKRITELDKTKFALASYNLGYGYLEQARVITQKNGDNPDLWDDVKKYLPLLNDLEGVDGKTAVKYVENIYVYQNLLQWKEQH